MQTPDEVTASPPGSRERIIWDLLRYGYFWPMEPDGPNETQWKQVRIFNLADIEDEVAKFQRFSGVLREDGEFGPVTQAHHDQRCCSVPDFVAEEARDFRSCPDVTTSHRVSLRGLTDEVVHELWLEVLDDWSKVCGLRATYVRDMDEAMVYAKDGRTDDNVLGWSYLRSGCNSRMEQRYSDRHRFNRSRAKSLIAHELGHAWSLGHGSNRGIMNPTLLNFEVPQDEDIRRIREIYGPPAEEPDGGWQTVVETQAGTMDLRLQMRRRENGSGGDEWEI